MKSIHDKNPFQRGRQLGEDLGESDLIAMDRDQQFDAQAWKQLAAARVLRMCLPASVGGDGRTYAQLVEVLRGLGLACRDNGLLFALGAHLWACLYPISVFATRTQRARYLERLMSGELIAAHAATEEQAGSDIGAIQTTARKLSDCYVLNGAKSFITNAPIAGLFLVLARVDETRGLTAFLVERESAGLKCSANVPKMGLRTSQMGTVEFRDCTIPLSSVLGEEGGGMTVFACSMELERVFILAPAIGAMERLLQRCVDYSRARCQSGKPIAPVGNRIVEIKRRIMCCHALLTSFAVRKDLGGFLGVESAMAKLQISEAWVETCLDAMQIHGGKGYLVEGEIERELRDAIASRIYSGTSDVQRSAIATFMRLGPAAV